jgi:hypothetical protein
MRLSTRLHGILDYLTGAFLMVAPWVLGFARGGLETGVMVTIGAAIVLYSLLTDYEFGVVRRIQMPLHLWMDGIGGLLLAGSPWIFAFDQVVRFPYLVIGVLQITLAFFTNTIPGYERRKSHSLRAG